MTNTFSSDKKDRPASTVFRVLAFLSSVRFGIFLLIALGVVSIAGMLIVQQNVDGFAAFYAELTPSQRTVLEYLGLFNVYHSWYYSTLLALLAMNIILASVDRFPSTWKLIREPHITMSPARFESSPFFRDYFFGSGDAESAAEAAAEDLRARGFRDIRKASAGSARFVFAQKGSWNRLGAYAVHVALLVLLFGGSLTAWFARSGEMDLRPGSSSRQIVTTEASADRTRRVTMALPFEVRCRDIRQKLIDTDGSIRPDNTLDWITELTVVEDGRSTDLTVSLNSPADYGGYRFLHSSAAPLGKARSVTLSVTGPAGASETMTIQRSGEARLKDGTKLRFIDFRAGFDMRSEDPTADTSDYESPAAVIEVSRPDGEEETAFVFGGQMAEMPVAREPVFGYTFRIESYERVADLHVLFVRRDPGQPFVYAGFGLLAVSLMAVFLFSHRRVWVRADGESEGVRVRIAGDTNRPYDTFPAAFSKISAGVIDSIRCQDDE
ncbi:MAG: cytochrome c biogenesis protein ResB [Acidobacteriota bacterium]|nr:MAG: cytochrome c biogenesis protein ResB [Acidobacteriota bacterium]